MTSRNFKQGFKLILIGDESVGKTSIIARFAEIQNRKDSDGVVSSSSSGRGSKSDSDEEVVAQRTTVGASFCQVRLKTPSAGLVTLNVWDTAGQERFRCMVGMYYRNTDAALAVYDVTNHRSFLSLKKWIREVRENTQNEVVIIVVGNKTDLRTLRTVDPQEAANFASDMGAGYVETNVKNHRKIQHLFSDLTDILVRRPNSGKGVFTDSFHVKQSPPPNNWKTRNRFKNKNGPILGCCSYS